MSVAMPTGGAPSGPSQPGIAADATFESRPAFSLTSDGASLMPNSAYATFIEDCRLERAHLFGLIEALEGNRIAPGARIIAPGHMVAATAETLKVFQETVTQLNTLIDAYDSTTEKSN